MPYRHKASEPYAEFVQRERGPSDMKALTLELDATFDESFIAELKTMPAWSRAWDADNKRWRIHPDYRPRAIEIAKQHYRHVYLVEGATTTDLITGEVYSQGSLF